MSSVGTYPHICCMLIFYSLYCTYAWLPFSNHCVLISINTPSGNCNQNNYKLPLTLSPFIRGCIGCNVITNFFSTFQSEAWTDRIDWVLGPKKWHRPRFPILPILAVQDPVLAVICHTVMKTTTGTQITILASCRPFQELQTESHHHLQLRRVSLKYF